MFRCLDAAINSLEAGEAPPPDWAGKLITGVTGGVGGFFGMYALPIELPLTTTLMLRTIAGIAREEGEDMAALEPRLACLEVFALGGGRPLLGGRSREQVSLEYYGVRTLLGSITRDLGRQMMERGAVHASSPPGHGAADRRDRRPLRPSHDLGPARRQLRAGHRRQVGGATVNMIFMDHFQRVARGHFYRAPAGAAPMAPHQIRRYYEAAAAMRQRGREGRRRQRRTMTPAAIPEVLAVDTAWQRRTAERRAALRRARIFATTLLFVMLVVFSLCWWYEPALPWLGYPRAFAEAGVIGAVADWFAVVALFRRPMGLPIPHTAILPRNKQR